MLPEERTVNGSAFVTTSPTVTSMLVLPAGTELGTRNETLCIPCFTYMSAAGPSAFLHS